MSEQLRYLLTKNPNAYVSEVTDEVLEEIKVLESERVALKADVEDLIWNLAGCSTFALGYGLNKPFDKTKARAAMHDVLRCAKDRDHWKQRAERMAEALKQLFNDLDDQCCDEQPTACSLRDMANQALAEFEGKEEK